MNIVLIGFMGSGKSAVAKELSKLLQRSCIEMDDLVLQKTAVQSMREVFERGGEILLRETEIAIAKEVASKQNLVVSTGGGVVLNKIVLDYFKEGGGKVVFLNASFEQIAVRLEGDQTRPLFKDVASAKQLYDFRRPFYLHYADKIVDVDARSICEIASHIKGWIDGL